ncbi:MAG: hypothetical protein HGA45_40385, partial [Chloroflexales bacterium]|nr:hypothetical protein [Chloroflexales bacterium]
SKEIYDFCSPQLKLLDFGYEILSTTEDCCTFFTELREEDRKNAVVSFGKDHFTPNFRSLFITKMYSDNPEKSFYYATSHIVGDFRGYRRRTTETAHALNIFASAKTLDDCLKEFVEKYSELNYNQTPACVPGIR